MATASLAVPKSVMKTIVGRGVEAACKPAEASFWAGCREQETHHSAGTRMKSANRRMRRFIRNHYSSKIGIAYSRVNTGGIHPDEHAAEGSKSLTQAGVRMARDGQSGQC